MIQCGRRSTLFAISLLFFSVLFLVSLLNIHLHFTRLQNSILPISTPQSPDGCTTLFLSSSSNRTFFLREDELGKSAPLSSNYGRLGSRFSTSSPSTPESASKKQSPLVFLMILSDLRNTSITQRQKVRDTWLQLVNNVTKGEESEIVYRFVVGKPSKEQELELLPELQKYGDLLILNSEDGYQHLTKKSLNAISWGAIQYLQRPSNHFAFLVKTDHDIYVRLDVVLSELSVLLRDKPTQAVTYWSGFVHHHMVPIQDKKDKNADTSYPLPLFPPYTVGALYILSSHLLQVIASAHSSPGGGSSKLSAIANEDQTLGFILDHFHFSPKHDRRIQQWNVCAEDMIAFHFSDEDAMTKFHSGVTQYNDPCYYLTERKAHCPLCYEECAGAAESQYDWRTHWICSNRGATLRKRIVDDPAAKQRRRRGLTTRGAAPTLSSDGAVRVSTGILGSYDHSKTVLSRSRVQQTYYSTTFSCDPNYNWSETPEDNLEPRFILIWTTAPSSFTLRQHRVLESIIFHHPRAQILIFSNSLPCNFFTTLSSLIHVNLKIVRYNLETLGTGLPGSGWIRRIKEWEKKPHFYAHSADLLRMLLLYRYGGVYMDFDVVLLHRLHLENTVIGEYCDDLSLEYCLFLPELGSLITSTPFADRHYRFYIPIGMLIFKPEHPLVFKTLSYFDSSYNPDLWPCGTIFLTKAVQTVCPEVSLAGGGSKGKCDDVWMLPPESVYPVEWHSRSILTTRHTTTQRARGVWANLKEESIAIHLWNKMTADDHPLPGTVLYEAFEDYALFPLQVEDQTHLQQKR